jgi:alginate O-acetyltransferase complex protein AlgI
VAGWGIFYFEDFSSMMHFFSAFFGNATTEADIVELNALTDNFWLWTGAVLFAMPLRRWVAAQVDRLLPGENVAKAVLFTSSKIVLSVVLLTLSVALLVGATNNAFIYTRF